MRKGNAGGWLLLGVSILLASAMSSVADDAGRKLGRGLCNTLFGVAEVPIQIQRTTTSLGGGAGATYGVVKGVGHFLMREGVGVYEILTFPIPYPRYYEPIIEPEFLFSETGE